MSDQVQVERKWVVVAGAVGSVIGSLMGLVGAVFLTGEGPTQGTVCESQAFEKLPSTAHNLCAAAYRRVSVDVAEQAMSEFLGRAAGAQPELGWNLFGPATREEIPRDEFVRSWRPVVFAQRVGPGTPLDGVFNGYRFTYRTYALSGTGKRWTIVDKFWEVQLRFDQDGLVKLTSRKPARSESQRDTGVRVATVTASSSKTLNSPVDGSYALAKVKQGTQLRLICNIDVGKYGWWVRTPDGFIAQDDLDIGEGALSAVDLCDHHFAVDALASKAGR